MKTYIQRTYSEVPTLQEVNDLAKDKNISTFAKVQVTYQYDINSSKSWVVTLTEENNED